ncbi:MAG: 23S rRNA (pseudouridine(1915)-N(3))-methyltransferase RlmH [Bacteroidota bacterium]
MLAVGRMRDRHLAAVCDDYVARVRRHLPLEVIEVEDDAALLRRLPDGGEVIALEAGGESWNTAKLTTHIEDGMVHGRKTIAFLIGSSDGLSPAVVARAGRRLSLSAMTLPHRLARVVLCEQIYRALSIIKGEPYNR